jgi:hypothetical protein
MAAYITPAPGSMSFIGQQYGTEHHYDAPCVVDESSAGFCSPSAASAFGFLLTLPTVC